MNVIGNSYAIGGSSTYMRKLQLKIHPDKLHPTWGAVATYYCARFGEFFSNLDKEWNIACEQKDEEKKRELEDLNRYIQDASKALRKWEKDGFEM